MYMYCINSKSLSHSSLVSQIATCNFATNILQGLNALPVDSHLHTHTLRLFQHHPPHTTKPIPFPRPTNRIASVYANSLYRLSLLDRRNSQDVVSRTKDRPGMAGTAEQRYNIDPILALPSRSESQLTPLLRFQNNSVSFAKRAPKLPLPENMINTPLPRESTRARDVMLLYTKPTTSSSRDVDGLHSLMRFRGLSRDMWIVRSVWRGRRLCVQIAEDIWDMCSKERDMLRRRMRDIASTV